MGNTPPYVSLQEARKMTQDARVLLTQGINPMEERKVQKHTANPRDRAFGIVALKWWEQQKDSWSPDHAIRVKRWLTNDAKAISSLAID